MNTDVPQRSPPSAGREYAAALALALALYLVSMAPGVLWQDGGMAQVRVLQRDLHGDLGLALSHPLYYVIAIAFQYLPFSDSAFKTNLVSAVFGAVTVANAYILLRLVTGGLRGAVVGALSLALAHAFWQQCAMAEVYALSSALLTGELLCLWCYARTARPEWLVLLFGLNGLGVSNHLLALLSLGCYALMMLALMMRRRVAWRWGAVCVPAWLVGAGLYLGMVVAELAAGAAVGETIRSALFGNVYASQVLSFRLSPRLLASSALYLALDFPTPIVLLAFPGVTVLRTARQTVFTATVGALLIVHLLWAVRYDVPDQYAFFFLAIVLIAITVGLGADRFLRRRDGRWFGVLVAGALVPIAVYAALPPLARSAGLRLGLARTVPYRDEAAYFLRPWKTGYRGAERFAKEVDATLPDGAVLFADGTTAPPIHYRQLTGDWRNRARVFPPATRADRAARTPGEDDLKDELAGRLVYVVTPLPGYCPMWLAGGYEFEEAGPIYRVARRKP